MTALTKKSVWIWAGIACLILDPVFDHVWAANFIQFPYMYKDIGRVFFLSAAVGFLAVGFALMIKQKKNKVGRNGL